MTMDDKNKFMELVLKAFDGCLSPEEVRMLNEQIIKEDEAARLYAEFFDAVSGLVDRSDVSFEEKDSVNWDTWFSILAQDEKSAPTVDIPREETEKVLIQKVVYAKSPRPISKFNMASAVLSTAAILFIVLFLRFTPTEKVEVAVLSDSMNAVWDRTNQALQIGTRLAERSSYQLQQGLAELLFDTNARVVVEAPAEFKILSDDRIHLLYGRIYARVPQEAIGFTVNAPAARIIDLGTEFGVEADARGNTYLHMLKGKTTLIAGDQINKVSMEVEKGAAKKISGETQAIMDIVCRETYFVRDFDSKTKAVWRRQPALDLADIAAGGNGLGTGQANVIIHPQKGYTEDSNYRFLTPQGFLPISSNPFLDGIFVPDGSYDLPISTRGDTFSEAPVTSGLFSIDLVVNPTPTFFRTDLREGRIEFDGQLYGADGKPCITMHANIGLTFDLAALRDSFNCDFEQFTSRIGIADLQEDCPCNADFWVLVDGQVRYSLRQYRQKGELNEMAVDLKAADRFLTLVTTDGGDPDNPQGGFYERSISCDWCVFTEPELVLKQEHEPKQVMKKY